MSKTRLKYQVVLSDGENKREYTSRWYVSKDGTDKDAIHEARVQWANEFLRSRDSGRWTWQNEYDYPSTVSVEEV